MYSIMYHSSCELLSVKVDKSGALKIRKKRTMLCGKFLCIFLFFFVLMAVCVYPR